MACDKCDHTGFAWGDIPCECVTDEGTKFVPSPGSEGHLPPGTKICASLVYSDTMKPWKLHRYLNLIIVARIENVGAYIHKEVQNLKTNLALGHIKYKTKGTGNIHQGMFVPGYLTRCLNGDPITEILILDKHIIKVIEDVKTPSTSGPN